jgi:hypothetical protein
VPSGSGGTETTAVFVELTAAIAAGLASSSNSSLDSHAIVAICQTIIDLSICPLRAVLVVMDNLNVRITMIQLSTC